MPSQRPLTGSVEAGKIKRILLLVLILPLTLIHSGCVGLAGSNSLPLALSNPAPSSVSSNSAMVSWTTNAPGTSQVEYGTTTNYGLKTVFDPTLVTNHAQALTPLTAGTTYHYRVHSKDAGGIEAVSGDFNLTTAATQDTTPPSVSITAPAPGATVAGAIIVSANATDNVGVLGVQFLVDGNNTGAEVMLSPYAYSLNTTTLSNGNHVLTAVARDAAGNRGTSAPVSVVVNNQVVDTTPPTVTITSPAPAATVSGMVGVVATASDNVGVVGVQFKVDGNNTGAEILAAPYIYSLNTATLSNGSHSLTAVARDAAGNRGTSAPITIAVNNQAPPTPPTISISSPASGANVSGTITVSTNVSTNTTSVQFQVDGSNTGAPVISAPFSYSLNTTTLSNASHTISAVASNSSSQTASASVAVNVNNTAPPTPPTISISSPASGATVSGTISVSTSVSSNTVSVQFKVDGSNTGAPVTSAPFSYSLNTTTLSNANHTISAVASNSSGQTASAAVTVNVNNTAPPTPPTISISSPASGANVSGTISVSTRVSSNTVSVQFKVDGSNTGNPVTIAPFSYSLDTTTLPNGNHSISAVASNSSGQTASASITVNVNNLDTTPPTISIISPASGATVSGTIAVSANASDNVGVVGVQFKLDGANLGSEVLSSPYSISWNTAGFSNASHSLTAMARDAAGNSTTSAAVSVTVSNSVSVVSVSISPTSTTVVTGGTQQFATTVTGSTNTAVTWSASGAGSVSSSGLFTAGASAGSATVTATSAADATKSASAAVTVTAPPPPGTQITSFQLTSGVTGTLPFTVGLGFKKGDIAGVPILSIAASQVVVKTRWADGSVKHAIASGQVALTAGVPLTVSVTAGSAVTGTNLTAADIQAANPSASVQLGSFGTVSLSNLLATPFRAWISGPQMVEAHYRSSVGSDPTLAVWFHVRLYKGGRIWIRASVENGSLDLTNSDKSYAPTVSIGGAVVYSGASLIHYGHTRWTVEGWIGGDPQVTPKLDTTYLMNAKLVPNYWKRNPSATALNALYQSYSPMQNGGWTADMGSTGAQDQIGLVPLWDSLYLNSGADARAYRSVLASAKALSSYAIVWTDSANQLPTIPSLRPTWSVQGNGGGGATNWGAGPLSWDVAHHGSGGYIAYLITGDYYYLETMQDQSAMCYLINGSGSGSGTSRILQGQTRATAWCQRTIGQLTGIAPSDPVTDDYRTLLSSNAAHWKTIAQQSGQNPLGYLYSYELETNVYGIGVVAPWQQHFWVQTYGLVSDLEPFVDMTTWNAVRDYLYMSPVGILGPVGTSNYCYTKASNYNITISSSSNADPRTWSTSWGAVYQNTTGVANTSCGSTLEGSSGSDPANASTGFWGNLLPAIAYAVDHGAPGAAAAWTRLTSASNWSTVSGSGFDDTPIWGIVPRTGVAPPPPPTVAVTVSPTTASVQVGMSQQFAATVTGSTNTSVTWSASGAGTVSSSGLFMAGASAGTATVTATSAAAPTKSASAAVTVTSAAPPVVAVTITPASASVQALGTLQFSAQVTGSTNTAASWSSTGCGSVSSAGLYTAPSSACSATVIATSVADPTKSASAAVVVTAPPPPSGILQVGPGMPFATPCAAIAVAPAGATITVDSAGSYAGDACAWSTDGLTIRGVGAGRPVINANGQSSQGKAIWVISAPNTTIENFELTGASVVDLNGAPIRMQGTNLTLRNSYIHDNQEGILGGDDPNGTILIEFCEFARNGAGDGHSHNVYIGQVGTLIFRYNWSHDAVVGHLVKSRALNNYILYNLLSDQNGTASYEVDLPAAGLSYVIGNLIEKGTNPGNGTLLTYMEENGTNPINANHQLYVVNNTFVNDFTGGTFVYLDPGAAPAVVKNNIFLGPGSVTNQASATLGGNFSGDPLLVSRATLDYHLTSGSPAINAGVAPGTGSGQPLTPGFQYVHPACAETRALIGAALDVGGYEFGGSALPLPANSPSRCGLTPPPPAPVAVTVIPASASLQVLQTVQFSAQVTGSTNTAVTWSLVGCGTISATGLYTAPATPCTPTVKVTVVVDPTKSAQASVTVTAPVSGGGGIPATLGWYQIPNTMLAPQCPNDPALQGATGCAAVIGTWSGGAADTARNRLIVWGGGHHDYWGNEVYALDLNSLTMQRIINPSPPNPTPDVCVTTLPDGNPNSRHTYAGLAYLANVDRMFVFGGGPACNQGGFSNDTWTLNMASLQWQSLSPAGGTPGANQVASAYDPNSHKVFLHVQGQLWSYDYGVNAYTQLPDDGLSWNQKTGVIDPKRQLFFAVGSGEFGVTSIAAGSSFVTQNWASQVSGCAGWLNGTSPGAAYDPVQDRIVGWAGGDTVYLFNPDTKSCTTQTFSGGPGSPQGDGTFGRWQYFPALRVFIIVNDWQQNAYSLRMTP